MVKKQVPEGFLKNYNWAYLWINSLKFYTVSFYCMQSWGPSKYIETKLQTTCFYLLLSFSKEQKEVSKQSSCPIFCIIFEKKYFSCYVLLIDQVSLPGCLSSWEIGKYVYCNCLLTRLWRHEFWSYSHLSNQAVFLTWPKSHDKNLTILRKKRALKVK